MSHAITIGPAIRAIRKAHGLGVGDLAQQVNLSGPYLTNIERGVKKPALETALRIAYALGVPPEAITYACPTCAPDTEVA
ncbi:MAG TPA: helix-turn-helix transcriptional regulator [Beutenbergiaceae bacterium]|nr:helix-turn-helix transcriptional regulator [Beutenbergiaceae bacterium]